ncbi:sporulation integral membrane protein YtvI [Paenibacillus cisolokensis]|uniref:sporulation integral membrane protein YtvI n=1 Tax=Paenibacillus cisolokensis TaxID=1658519 RepID=UPI003D2B2374
MERYIWSRLMRAGWVAACAAAIVLAVRYVTPLIYPFIIAWLLAYALQPFVGALQRRARLPRWLAVTIALLVCISSLLVVLAALITRIVAEVVNLSGSVENVIRWWREQFDRFVSSPEIQMLIRQLSSFYNEHPDYRRTINDSIFKSADILTDISTSIVGLFFQTVRLMLTSLPNVATLLVIIVLAAFFISKDWSRHAERIGGWLPSGIRITSGAVWADLQQAITGYIRAQLLLISITATAITAGLIILRVEYALTIGILIGLVDLLPYLGVGAVMIPWIAYKWLYGDVTLAIGLSVLYGIVLIARQMIEPKVMASTLGVDPLFLLIAMFAGLQLLGVPGLIVAPIALVFVTALHRANVFRDLIRYIMGDKR